MDIKKLYGKTRAAISDYSMISAGDNIALGLSGGKDSLVLCMLLKGLSKYIPEHFDMTAVCVDLGFEGFDTRSIAHFCDENKIKLHIEKTHIAKIVFDVRKPKSPCALCANLRRGALNNAAKALGCNKVALAHHSDDAIETLMMSMLYEGRASLFAPSTYLTRSQLHVIRPLIYLTEEEIKEFIKYNNISPVKNPCYNDGNSRRETIKNICRDLYKINPAFKQNLFNTILTSGKEGW